MKKVSEKMVTLLSISSFLTTEEGKNDTNANGLLLFTPSGIIFGEVENLEDSNSINSIINDVKKNAITDEFELIGDGSTFPLKNATIITNDSKVINLQTFTVFCDQVTAFSLADIDSLRSAYNV